MCERRTEGTDAHYVCLFNWTDQGIRNVRDTLERVDRASELAEQKYGVSLGQIYWTVGPYDTVGVFEAPDQHLYLVRVQKEQRGPLLLRLSDSPP